MVRNTSVIRRMPKDTKATITNHLDSYTEQEAVVKNNLAIAQGRSWLLVLSKATQCYNQKP